MTEQLSLEPGLEQALLTMDVVDSLRHEQTQLDRHADVEGQTEALKDRLARIYRSQGMQVSEEILDAGVRAQIDGRFRYAAPTGWRVHLARIYIDRIRHLKTSAKGAGLMGLAVLGYLLIVVMPREWAIREDIKELNLAMETVSADHGDASRLSEEALRDLSELGLSTGKIAPTLLGLKHNAQESIDTAETILSGIDSPLHSPLVRDDYETLYDTLNQLVVRSKAQLKEARASIREADSGVEAYQTLSNLYAQWVELDSQLNAADFGSGYRSRMAALQSSALTALIASDIESARKDLRALASGITDYSSLMALRDEARALADVGVSASETEDGKDALRNGLQRVEAAVEASDMRLARLRMGDLRSVVEVLLSEYSLQVVNRQNTRSGVWRHPSGDRSKRNFYLIVEALNPSGRAVRLPIVNEETGNTERVNTFGVRVTESQFEKVKADKLDNNLIDKPYVGKKRKGYLVPDFAVDVAGGYITRW